MGEVSYREIRAEFESRREAGELRFVQGTKHDSARSFTTPETMAAERANIRYVLEGRNAVEPMMTAERAQEQAVTRSFLNDSQRRVIEEVLNSSDRIHGLQGLAGIVKTTTLQVIREGAEASGYVVEGFARLSRRQGSFVRLESTPQRLRASSPVDRITRALTQLTGISICWTSRALPAQDR